MDRQNRAVAGHGQLAGDDRRRVEAMIEDHLASTDVGFGPDSNGQCLIAGDKVAAAGIVFSGRRLAADRREVGPGIGA